MNGQAPETMPVIPEIIGRAVELGLWEAEAAFELAQEMQDAEQRGLLYAALLATAGLDASQRHHAQTLSVQAAAELSPDRRERASVLLALIPHLDEEALRAALDAAVATSNLALLQEVFEALAPQLDDEMRGYAREAAQTVWAKGQRNEYLRTSVMGVLNRYLRGEVAAQDAPSQGKLEQALDDALARLRDDYDARALERLAPYLTDELRERALHAASMEVFANPRLRALLALAGHLPGKLRQLALERVLETIPQLAGTPDTLDEEVRAGALQAIAPYLTDDLLQRALDFAQGINSNRERAYALGALAAQLEGKPRQAVLRDALEAAFAWPPTLITHEMGTREGLICFAPLLEGELLQEVLDKLLDPQDWPEGRQRWLEAMPEDIADHERAGRRHWQAKALGALAPQLNREQVEQVLEAVAGWEAI